MQRALAFLEAGRMERYRRACAELVEAFQDSPVSSNRGKVAWQASMTNNPLIDSAAAVAMAHFFYGEDQNSHYKEILALGGAYYRNGQYDEANQLLIELAERLASDGDWTMNYETPCAKYFLSMSRFAMGHAFQAQRFLDEANVLAENYRERAPARSWQEILTLKTLREEATAMLADP